MKTIDFVPSMARREKGFSLIELLIALVLGVILLGGLALLLQTVSATRVDAERLSRMQENLRFAADYLVRDIRNAGFRDEVEISVAEFGAIGQGFAEVSGGGQILDIQYAGRGSCAEEFDGFRPVRNRYFVGQDNSLTCIGFRPNGTTRILPLTAGIVAVSFALLREDPAGVAGSVCNLDDVNPCIGVRITFTIQGVDQTDDRSVALLAAFRNVILPGVTDVSF
jgi:prepilin-type N-terminal cleavage/methylation domain-containing protein